MKKVLVFLIALTAACATDSPTAITDESAATVSSSAVAGQATAIVTVDGRDYEIGCPDYPCPVSQIVLNHIAQKMFFWMPPGTFKDPAIYLYVLRTPVLLHDVPEEVIEPPPPPPPVEPVPPSLSGPTIMMGRVLPPIDQVTCGDFALKLLSPDGGPWEFVSGEVEYEYVSYDAGTNSWVPTGSSNVVGFNATVWNELLGGTYRLYPPFPKLDYYAHFTVMLRRGSYEAEVQHTLLCAQQLPPPAPTLTGPGVIQGTAPGQGQLGVQCTVDLDLYSPDGGPWSFVSGQRVVQRGTASFAQALTSGDWLALLAGTYKLNANQPWSEYAATFNVTVERGQYQHALSHTLVCTFNKDPKDISKFLIH